MTERGEGVFPSHGREIFQNLCIKMVFLHIKLYMLHDTPIHCFPPFPISFLNSPIIVGGGGAGVIALVPLSYTSDGGVAMQDFSMGAERGSDATEQGERGGMSCHSRDICHATVGIFTKICLSKWYFLHIKCHYYKP